MSGLRLEVSFGMRRVFRGAFIALLSLALSASGATLGLAQIAAHASLGQLGHHAPVHAHHEHHVHDGAAPAPQDEGPQKTGDHPSKNCCSACTVLSPLPRAPDTLVELVVSLALYPSHASFNVAVAPLIDPGIPKRMG